MRGTTPESRRYSEHICQRNKSENTILHEDKVTLVNGLLAVLHGLEKNQNRKKHRNTSKTTTTTTTTTTAKQRTKRQAIKS